MSAVRRDEGLVSGHQNVPGESSARDRLTVPPRAGQWNVRFGTSAAATGWDQLCRPALANTRRCLESYGPARARVPIMTASTGHAEISPRIVTTTASWSSGSTK
jgi:hypothetical protein